MTAFLLKELEFEDLLGDIVVLPKGAVVNIDQFDECLIVVPAGQLDYIVKVTKNDYRILREMN